MKSFLHQIIQFIQVQHPWALLWNSVWVGFTVFLNFYFKISKAMLAWSLGWQLLFFVGIFTLIYGVSVLIHKTYYKLTLTKDFYLFFITAVLIFSFKSIPYHKEWTTFVPSFVPQVWEKPLFHWLVKDIVILTITVFFLRKLGAKGWIPGFSWKNVPWRIILICWIIMIPLLVWAGFQPGFLAQYPKMSSLMEQGASKVQLLFFELLYSFDFLIIEVFFRGLLVIAAFQFLGEHAILTMASFYCAIHFGKPLPECISSYFGGTILGVLALRSGKITSGFLIHVSVALGMEITSYLGKK